MEATKHAIKRISKRLGVPKKTVSNIVDQMVANGTPRANISGSLRRYIDKLILKEGANASDAIIYRNYVFLTHGPHVITAWLLPDFYKSRRLS